MAKRVLWLSNNTEQRSYEVPRLILAGYEVYCPKVCGYGLGENYLGVSYDYDESLSLDSEVIENLNKIDLYGEEIISQMDVINDLFEIVFMPPIDEVIRRIVHHFTGTIVLRWIGDEDGLTCTERIIKDGGYSLLYQINRIKNRFYFAYSSEWEIADECDLLRGRSVFMPLPMMNEGEKTVQSERTGLLLCPNIRLNEDANKAFRLYKKILGNTFQVLGEQLVPPENHREMFVGNDIHEQKRVITSVAVAVDSGLGSTLLNEPWRRIVSAEIPLLYTRKSIAKELLGVDSPGYCKNENELNIKYRRLIKGDRSLEKKIVDYQNRAKQVFSIQNCNLHWDAALYDIMKNAENQRTLSERRRRICVVLPVEYLGGVLSFTKRFVLALWDEIKKHGNTVELVFAHIQSINYTTNDSFVEFKEAGIPIREISIAEMEEKVSEKMLEMGGYIPTKWHGDKTIPTGIVYDDGIHMLMDCDYLIDMTDRSGDDELPLYPIYPYAVVAHDYIQRYSPMGGDEVFIPMARNADKVFVTSVPTYNDAIQYTMIKKEKLVLLPLLFEMSGTCGKKSNIKPEDMYFLWSTNVSRHKNHTNALKALNQYYRCGGKLKCHITGFLTQYINPENSIKKYAANDDYRHMCIYLEPIREYIDNHPILKNNLVFEGYLQPEEFNNLVKNACFIFHPGYGDNGNGTALDGATFGVPTLSHDYPAMRYLSESTDIMCHFADINNKKEAVDALLWMQENWEKCASEIEQGRIERHSLEYIKDELYKRLDYSIGFNVEVQR